MSSLASGGPLGFGYYNATAIQHGTGYLHVAYSNGDNDDVLLRWWNGSAWQVQTVDDGRDVARGIDLAFTAGHQPAVSYAGGALKYAERSGATWTIKTIESGARNDVTRWSSPGESPPSRIPHDHAQEGAGRSTLKLARRSGTTWTKTSIAPGVRYSRSPSTRRAIRPSRLPEMPTAIPSPIRCGSHGLSLAAGRSSD